MAAKPRPSFLKRQKEMKRKEKAAAKQALREQKRQSRLDGSEIKGPPMATLNEFGEIVDLDADAVDSMEDGA